MKNDEKSVVGTVEVAEIFGCSIATISKWCREKKFPNAYQKSSGHPWHIPLSDVEIRKGELSRKKE